MNMARARIEQLRLDLDNMELPSFLNIEALKKKYGLENLAHVVAGFMSARARDLPTNSYYF